jgi:hypothetical protein
MDENTKINWLKFLVNRPMINYNFSRLFPSDTAGLLAASNKTRIQLG